MSTYRQLIRLRGLHPALVDGATAPLESSDSKVVGFVRVGGPKRFAVLANVSTSAVAAPSFALGGGAAGCSGEARVIYRTGATDPGSTTVAGPVVDATGAFRDWIPFDSLPARSLTIVDLGG